MVGDEARDQSAIDRRKQDALFDLEMVCELELIAIDRLARQLRDIARRGVLAQRAFRQDTERQPIVMLLRERNQAAVAEHKNLASRSIAGSSTERSAA